MRFTQKLSFSLNTSLEYFISFTNNFKCFRLMKTKHEAQIFYSNYILYSNFWCEYHLCLIQEIVSQSVVKNQMGSEQPFAFLMFVQNSVWIETILGIQMRDKMKMTDWQIARFARVAVRNWKWRTIYQATREWEYIEWDV